jgi:hypothetical protein
MQAQQPQVGAQVGVRVHNVGLHAPMLPNR